MTQWETRNKTQYNAWRKEYRKKMKENGKCPRCYRPLVEEWTTTHCINCVESSYQRDRMSKEIKRGTY